MEDKLEVIGTLIMLFAIIIALLTQNWFYTNAQRLSVDALHRGRRIGVGISYVLIATGVGFYLYSFYLAFTQR
jgi:hypothetical protein